MIYPNLVSISAFYPVSPVALAQSITLGWIVLGYVLIAVFAVSAVYRLFLIVSPRIVRNILNPSISTKVARVRKSRSDEGAQAYWEKSEQTREDLGDDMQERYGAHSKVAEPDPPSTLADRIRTQGPWLVASLLLLGLAIVTIVRVFH